MDESNEKEESTVKCSIRGCPGEYEERQITHTTQHEGHVIVIAHVPAEVCSVCGDTLFKLQTVRRMEQLLHKRSRPSGNVPLYEYA